MSNIPNGIKNARRWRDKRRAWGSVPTAADVALTALESLPPAEWGHTVTRWSGYVGDDVAQTVRAGIAQGWMGALPAHFAKDLLVDEVEVDIHVEPNISTARAA